RLPPRPTPFPYTTLFRSGADPQKTLERLLGLWALRFLIIGLAISPLRQLGGPNLIRWRRAIGLLAFYYACLHLSVYMLLDQGLRSEEHTSELQSRENLVC